jgi:hypothetical protein
MRGASRWLVWVQSAWRVWLLCGPLCEAWSCRGCVVWRWYRKVSEVYGVMDYHGMYARRIYIASFRTKNVSVDGLYAPCSKTVGRTSGQMFVWAANWVAWTGIGISFTRQTRIRRECVQQLNWVQIDRKITIRFSGSATCHITRMAKILQPLKSAVSGKPCHIDKPLAHF